MAQAPDSLRVLLVEDDEDDFVITRDLLAGQRRTLFELDWVASYGEGRDAIRERRHDVYLIDYRLGERTGLDLVREAFSDGHQAPVIVLTGQASYEVDLEATLLGVTDFLEKGQLDTALLERSIRYAVGHHATLAELRQSEERYALAVRGANDGTWDWNLASERVYLSQRWKAMLGHGEDDVGDSMDEWLGRVHPDDVGELRAAIGAHLGGANSHLESEHRVAHRDGSHRWVLVRGAAIRDESGKATRVAGSMTDITDQKAAEARLLHESMHDSLTGLPNRALFLDRLEHSLARAERDHHHRCAVLFLDIDRFKLVNDGFSHAAGDRLLVALAHRLARNLRPGDTVARFGGDEFTILLDAIGCDEEPEQVAERIQEAMGRPFEVVGQNLVVSASIGISLSQEGSTPDEMVRDADIAMYNAKRAGAARSATFSSPMHSHVVSQLHLEGELRRAIDDRMLRVFYQPILDLRTGALSGFEALARWPESSEEEVSPGEFIPVAEETGLIGGLGRLVLDQACACLGDWRERDVVGPEVSVSVNVSARQFMEPNLVADVIGALERHRLPPGALRLEITESTVLWEPAYMTAVLNELATAGVRAQIDDFGTGYSSLTFLQHFAGDALKIDRSFVSSMNGSCGSDAIVRAVIVLAHNLGLEVVAEGVETSDRLDKLRELGCDYAQGFLLGRPLQTAEAERTAGSWDAARAPV